MDSDTEKKHKGSPTLYPSTQNNTETTYFQHFVFFKYISICINTLHLINVILMSFKF